MAMSAAARLLASSAATFRAGHNHHTRRRPLLLLPIFRFKTSYSSTKPRCPSPRREPSAPAAPASSIFEARSFGIMEELMYEMDKEMYLKDIKTWTILIASYGKARQIVKMLSTFETMKKLGSVTIDSKVYRTILHALCNAEKPELALEFYKDLPRNMEVGSDILRLLMCCLAKSDNAAEAICFVRDDMIKGMKHPEEYCYMEALRSFCISGKLEEAWKLFQKMKNKSLANPTAFEILLRGLCKAGRMDEALQIIEYMKSRSGISSTTYGFLIDGYLRKGEHTKALDLLQVMREYGCVPLVSSYTQLMQYLFEIDRYEEACGLYEEMLKNSVEPDIVTISGTANNILRA